jgi:sigma-E factor negative regulatory protein RseC
MSENNVSDLKSNNWNYVRHSGVISKMNKSFITVSLNDDLNCEGCKAKGACGVSDANSKEIEVPNTFESFALNEDVNLIMQKELGMKAVFWAYIFPFILMISVLLVASLFLKEWIAGLISLLVLAPYYLSLYVFNTSFQKTFRINIVKNK